MNYIHSCAILPFEGCIWTGLFFFPSTYFYAFLLCTQWSYGVTMWEIFSGGKSPYPGTGPLTLMHDLEQGHRMSQPYNTACNKEMLVYIVKSYNL